jgi:hypothetical protein
MRGIKVKTPRIEVKTQLCAEVAACPCCAKLVLTLARASKTDQHTAQRTISSPITHPIKDSLA